MSFFEDDELPYDDPEYYIDDVDFDEDYDVPPMYEYDDYYDFYDSYYDDYDYGDLP